MEVLFEIDVATHSLRIAVEGKPYKITLCIEDRRTRIAARDVVVRYEAGGQIAVFIGIDTKISGIEQVFELLGDDKLAAGRVFFLYNAFQSSVILVLNSVSGLITSYITVSYTDSRIGIGSNRLVFVDLKNTVDEITIATLYIGICLLGGFSYLPRLGNGAVGNEQSRVFLDDIEIRRL